MPPHANGAKLKSPAFRGFLGNDCPKQVAPDLLLIHSPALPLGLGVRQATVEQWTGLPNKAAKAPHQNKQKKELPKEEEGECPKEKQRGKKKREEREKGRTARRKEGRERRNHCIALSTSIKEVIGEKEVYNKKKAFDSPDDKHEVYRQHISHASPKLACYRGVMSPRYQEWCHHVNPAPSRPAMLLTGSHFCPSQSLEKAKNRNPLDVHCSFHLEKSLDHCRGGCRPSLLIVL